MKVALYKTSYGLEYAVNEGFYVDDWVRISDYEDIEFTPRQPNEILADQLDVLNTAEKELMAKYQQAKEVIQQKRNELLAITHQD